MLFWKLIENGGPVMWLLLFFSLVAMVVFLEKWFQFHREQINVGELMRGIRNVLKRDGYVEAISLCDNTPGPVPRIINAAILAHQRGDTDLKYAIDAACLDEIPRLERHLNVLSSIGYVAPLLGLLGTVMGMMGAFQTMHDLQSISLSVSSLSQSVNVALITTASGLSLAIPCCLAFNYLHARLDAMLWDMEKAAGEINAFFERRNAGNGGDPEDAE